MRFIDFRPCSRPVGRRRRWCRPPSQRPRRDIRRDVALKNQVVGSRLQPLFAGTPQPNSRTTQTFKLYDRTSNWFSSGRAPWRSSRYLPEEAFRSWPRPGAAHAHRCKSPLPSLPALPPASPNNFTTGTGTKLVEKRTANH